MSQIIPIPKIPITIRPGTIEDIPFLDSLQKMHTKQVGWMPTKQFEGKVKLGHVLVAESDEATKARSDEGTKRRRGRQRRRHFLHSLRRFVASSLRRYPCGLPHRQRSVLQTR